MTSFALHLWQDGVGWWLHDGQDAVLYGAAVTSLVGRVDDGCDLVA